MHEITLIVASNAGNAYKASLTIITHYYTKELPIVNSTYVPFVINPLFFLATFNHLTNAVALESDSHVTAP